MPDYNITTGLPSLPSALPNKEFDLVKPLYLAMNSLAKGVSIYAGQVGFDQDELSQQNQLGTLLTQNHRKLYALAVGSTLAFGKMVHLYLSSGKIAAEYADSTTNTKPAHGIVNNPLGINAGEYGEIVLVEGYSQGISGTTFGLYYYLSSNGDVQAGRPAIAGSIIQAVGFGLGTGGFYVHISPLFLQN